MSRRTHGISRRAHFYTSLPNGPSPSGCRLGYRRTLRVVANNLFGRQCSDMSTTFTALETGLASHVRVRRREVHSGALPDGFSFSSTSPRKKRRPLDAHAYRRISDK